jgi:Predicted membrane protein (DUF2231)
MAALAALAGLTDVLGDQRIRALNDVWWHAGGNVVVVLIQIVSWYLRYTQGNVGRGADRSRAVSDCRLPAGLHRLERLGTWCTVAASGSQTNLRPVPRLRRAGKVSRGQNAGTAPG